jgi:hypothetical protein
MRARLHAGDLVWTLAMAVALHGAVRTLAPEAPLSTLLVVFAIAGAFLRPGERWLPADGPVLVPALLGALLMAGLALATQVLDLAGPKAGGMFGLHGAVLAVLAIGALATQGTARRVGTLLGVEWLKLRKGWSLKGGLLVATALAFYVGFAHEPVRGQSGWNSVERSLGAGLLCAEMLLLVLGATSISAESAQGTLKMVLPHAYRRSEWIAAKALALTAGALLFTLLLTLASLALAEDGLGLGAVVKPGDEVFGSEPTVHREAGAMAGYVLEAVVASAAALVATAVAGLFFSCLFTGLVASLSAAFLAFATLHLGNTLLGFSPQLRERLYAEVP